MNLGKRVALAVVGVALTTGWWTIEQKFFPRAGSATADKIPARVWEGGGTTLTIETESSDPAVVRALFTSTGRTNGAPARSLDTYEKIAAGRHSWTVDVPRAVGGNVELQAENPKAGSKLSFTVRSGNQVLMQDAQTLDGALRPNEAFFLNVDSEDFSQPKEGNQE